VNTALIGRLRRRVAAALACFMVAAFSLAACGGNNNDQGAGSNAADGPTKMTIPSQPNETGFPVWLANKLGYFKENNLEVTIKYLPTGAAALAGGAAGDWQAGWLGGPPAITGWEKFGLITAGPEITEPKNLIVFVRADALKGRTPAEVLSSEKAATVPNSTSSMVLFACARHLGVDPKELDVTQLDPPAVLQALQAGQVSIGTGFSSPDYPFVVSKEYVQVCDGEKAGISLMNPYVVTPKFWKDNQQATAAFLEASYRAQEWMIANEDEAIDYLLEYSKEIGIKATKDSAKYSFSVRNWFTLDQAVDAMNDGTAVKAFQQLADYFVEAGVYQQPPDIEKMIETGRPVIQAAQEYRQKAGR